MADSIAQYFRPITHTFLDKEWEQGFSVYYKVKEGKQDKFLIFAEYTPTDFSRLEKIMKDADRQEFFIHENDLSRYYKECIGVRLRENFEGNKLPPAEQVKQMYSVNKRILGDYLDFDTSPRMLRALDEISEMLCALFEHEPIPFPNLAAMTTKDNSIPAHCASVGLYSLYLGKQLNISGKNLCQLLMGGLLSDIGKREYPEGLIHKEEELTKEEIQIIRKHPSSARKTLNDMKCYSENVLRMVGEHHENFDGTGYPFGMAGEKISPFARIGRVMDEFAALTSQRPYRQAFNPVKALSMIKTEMPGRFDQNVIAVLFRSLNPK